MDYHFLSVITSLQFCFFRNYHIYIYTYILLIRHENMWGLLENNPLEEGQRVSREKDQPHVDNGCIGAMHLWGLISTF